MACLHNKRCALTVIQPMSVHHLKCEQTIPAPLKKVWDFFSDPKNLATITPPYMNFKVTSKALQKEMYPGQIITYKVSPILGIPMFWMTEITHVEKEKFFVDEQRKGPYKIWHHEHHFEEKEGVVLMTDLLHYQLPLAGLGDVAHALFVRKQLKGIFNFRMEKVKELFG